MEAKYRWLYRSKNNQTIPSICVCHIKLADGPEALGLAICSNTDTPSRKVGRAIALQRAYHAAHKDLPELDIMRWEACAEVRDAFVKQTAVKIFDNLAIHHKAVPSGTDQFETIIRSVWPPREK